MIALKSIEFGYVNEVLSYSPDSGLFIWRVRGDVPAKWNGRFAGKQAGSMRPDGYVQIFINRSKFFAHRLAFLLMAGEMPRGFIDHIDGDHSNNVWSNLRLATSDQNNSNIKTRCDNTSGIKGVSWHKARQKWRASIGFGKKRVHLGLFDTIEEAAECYKGAALEFHKEFSNDGNGPIMKPTIVNGEWVWLPPPKQDKKWLELNSDGGAK